MIPFYAVFSHLCLCTNVTFHVCLFHLQAWEDTFAKWDQATKQILNFPKNKADDGQVSMLQRGSLLYLPLWVSIKSDVSDGTGVI